MICNVFIILFLLVKVIISTTKASSKEPALLLHRRSCTKEFWLCLARQELGFGVGFQHLRCPGVSDSSGSDDAGGGLGTSGPGGRLTAESNAASLHSKPSRYQLKGFRG